MGNAVLFRVLWTVSESEPMTKERGPFKSCDLSVATAFLTPSWFCSLFVSVRTWLSNHSRPT